MTTEPQTLSIEIPTLSLEALALLTGTPLVDLSIEREPHLVRGEN